VALVPPPIVRKEIALDASKLEPLTGVYELAPNFRLTVTREGDALFAQGTDQPKFPLYAEAETDFFLKAVDAQISFIRDSDGKVNGIVVYQNGGKTEGKRVK
jgi:serine-type D-Ala-D-Ala carboxypeptidase/endopeptidase